MAQNADMMLRVICAATRHWNALAPPHMKPKLLGLTKRQLAQQNFDRNRNKAIIVRDAHGLPDAKQNKRRERKCYNPLSKHRATSGTSQYALGPPQSDLPNCQHASCSGKHPPKHQWPLFCRLRIQPETDMNTTPIELGHEEPKHNSQLRIPQVRKHRGMWILIATRLRIETPPTARPIVSLHIQRTKLTPTQG